MYVCDYYVQVAKSEFVCIRISFSLFLALLISFTFSVVSLDEILDGGILTGELTEICGPPGAGKTQVGVSN